MAHHVARNAASHGPRCQGASRPLIGWVEMRNAVHLEFETHGVSLINCCPVGQRHQVPATAYSPAISRSEYHRRCRA